MMTGILALAAILAAQGSVSAPGPDPELIEQKDASYESLVNGDVDEAIAQLESRLLEDPQDPALLINLGAAYTGAGKYERASAAYRAAADSPVRYRLELADGSWVDSRRAARLALNSLDNVGAMATR